jgi:hypothetical protein
MIVAYRDSSNPINGANDVVWETIDVADSTFVKQQFGGKSGNPI